MADDLQVGEGSSGKDVRTTEVATNKHVPLNALFAAEDTSLAKSNRTYSEIERRQNAIKSSIEHWEAGNVGIEAVDQGGNPRPVELVDDGSGNYLLQVNVANQVATSIQSQSADLATQTTLASAAQVLSNAEDGDGDAFDTNVGTITDSVDLGSLNGAATETTLSSVLTQLQGSLDVSGATVTVTDNGAFNVTLDAESAGLAQDSTLADQESYDEFVVGPATDSVFNTPYNGLIVSSVDGDIEIQTGASNTKIIPQGFLVAGQVLPVTVAEISSTNTTQTVSSIMLVRN